MKLQPVHFVNHSFFLQRYTRKASGAFETGSPVDTHSPGSGFFGLECTAAKATVNTSCDRVTRHFV